MKGQMEKKQILITYVLLAQELRCMYLRNRKKNLTIKLDKGFLFNIRKKTFTKFIISSLEKSTKPEILT